MKTSELSRTKRYGLLISVIIFTVIAIYGLFNAITPTEVAIDMNILKIKETAQLVENGKAPDSELQVLIQEQFSLDHISTINKIILVTAVSLLFVCVVCIGLALYMFVVTKWDFYEIDKEKIIDVLGKVTIGISILIVGAVQLVA